MKTIDITLEEWKEFKKLGELQTPRSRFWQSRRWVAIFSVNARGHGWSFKTFGRTPFHLRNDLRRIKIVKSLREEYAALKADGGRVLVDRTGAYYKTGARKLVRFAAFRFPTVVAVYSPPNGS